MTSQQVNLGLEKIPPCWKVCGVGEEEMMKTFKGSPVGMIPDLSSHEIQVVSQTVIVTANRR